LFVTEAVNASREESSGKGGNEGEPVDQRKKLFLLGHLPEKARLPCVGQAGRVLWYPFDRREGGEAGDSVSGDGGDSASQKKVPALIS